MQKKPKTLRAVRPNLGVEAQYRREIDKLVRAMHEAVDEVIRRQWDKNEPATVASDVSPVAGLKKAIKELGDRWRSRFDQAAKRLADYFAKDVTERSDRTLKKILREGGFSVKFRRTEAVNDILGATVAANVALIKSIPEEYLGKVEGAVMRSVQAGRDLGRLTKDIQKIYSVSKRRAALIARDQNNKATASIQRARQLEIGVKQAIWMHSHAGKEPRPTHVKMNGKKFDVAQGMYDSAEGKYVMPGELINCRCVSKAIVPGFK